MATSGTTGQTTIDVTTVVEHAFRRCGKLASTISGELLQSARENLFFLLSDLANRGLSLFCVQQAVIPLAAAQNPYLLPLGTVDLLQALYRTVTPLSLAPVEGGSTSALNTAGQQPAALQVMVTHTGAGPAAINAGDLVVEWSSNGTTWLPTGLNFNLWAGPLPVTGIAQLALDVTAWGLVSWLRVRSLNASLLVSGLAASTNPVEIAMAKLNRDEYLLLPDKTFTSPAGSKSLQYWFDKQVAPQVWLWPAVSQSGDLLSLWLQTQIQDVGLLSGQLAVPQRWLESIILLLACRVAVELPAQELPPQRLEYLEAKAQEHLAQAEDGENDGAPIRLQPTMRGYTQ